MEKLPYRELIRAHLAALATLDGMVGPHELVCSWFDDLYLPSELDCPNGYPRDAWERGQREWRECFTPHELQVLSKFHEVFCLHVKALDKTQSEWRLDPHWTAVRDAAITALEGLESNP